MNQPLLSTKLVIPLTLLLLISPWSVIAQEEAEDQDELERRGRQPVEEIVVTGTRIEGTPKGGQLPVDVYTAADMEDIGSPSPVQFAKSLSIQGNTNGENSYLVGATASTQFNLRALGTARTLSLLNGLRTNPDINQNPQLAMSRFEILREGAAALYGASAVGGVVNTLTLPNFEGFKFTSEYTHIDGAEAEYDVGFLWGIGGEDLNFYTTLEHEFRPEIDTTDRPYTLIPYTENSTSSAPFGNPGTFRIMARDGNGNYNLLGSPSAALNGPTIIPDFDEQSCEDPGGAYRGLFAASFAIPVCSWNYTDFIAVQSEQKFTRSYSQLSGSIGNDVDYQVSLNLFKSLLPESRRSPVYAVSIGPGGYAVNRGATDQWTVPGNNPYVQDFLNQSGVDLSTYPGIDPNDPSTYGFSAVWWLPYGLNGNEATDVRANNGAAASRIEQNTQQLGFKLNGDIGETSLNWDVSGGYRRSTLDTTGPTEFGFRIQEALNGFGGPNCNAPDLVPYVEGDYSTLGTQNPALAGVGDCMYFNPFASAWAQGAVNGVANPRYVSGNENPVELSNWLFDKAPQRATTKVTELNLGLNGDLPLELPGGIISWAAGYQYLQTNFSRKQGSQFRVDAGPNTLQPCAWPEQQVGEIGCPGLEGPYMFTTLIEDVRNQKQTSNAIYSEFAIPLLSSLDFSLAARYEEYNSGIDTTVWKFATRWQALDWMAIRASYGTNFAEPDPSIVPGDTVNFVASIDRADGRWVGIDIVTSNSLDPEIADVWDVGILFDFQVGEGDMTIYLDYFDITINDEIATINADAIVNQVVSANGAVDCSHQLADLISWIGGSCVAGLSGADIGSVTTFRTNRPGRQVAGYDFDFTYNFNAFGVSGLFTTGIRSTFTTKYEQDAFIYQGIEFESAVDGNGLLNEGISLEPNSKIRGSVFMNYNQDAHNVRVDYVYRSGVEDTRPQQADLSIQGVTPTGFDIPAPQNNFAQEVKSIGIYNVFYTWQAADNLILRGGIENVTDKDPPLARTFMNYLQLQASARGRTAQLGLTYEF